MTEPLAPNVKFRIKETVSDCVNELKEDFIISVNAMTENMIKIVEDWEKYSENLKDYYEDKIDNLNDEIEDLKKQIILMEEQ